MTPENLDNMIAVLQAHKEGKTIQMKSKETEETGTWLADWTDMTPYNYNWADFDYRVKPEAPKEFWINVYPSGYNATHDSQEEAEEKRTKGGKTIHVREVVE